MAGPVSLLTDLHSHILPGIDDGAADMEDALAIARAALADGVHTMAATPHSMLLSLDMDRAALAARVDELQRRLEQEGLPLRVVPGAEVPLIAALPGQIDAGLAPTLNGSQYLLLEPPVHCRLSLVQDLIFQAQVRGYIPILAHPERSNLARDLDGLRTLVERGVLVQITAASLEGCFGRGVQKATRRLLRENLAHVMASDAHDARHRAPRLRQAEALAAEIIGAERAHALVADTPAAILAGESVQVEPPQPVRRRRWFF